MGRPTFAQALPAAEASPISTGFSLPTKAGDLRYGVSASESLVWGYSSNSGVSSYSNLSGDLGFISTSLRDPFSVVLAGGHAWATSGQRDYSFATLGLSQVLSVGRWNFVLADSLNYLPQSPTTGLTGLAGLGDLGLSPIQVGSDTAQSPLTGYATRVDNTASGSAQRAITGKTSVNASGEYDITRFVDNGTPGSVPGLDVDGWNASGGLTHQYSVRNQVSGNYTYSSYTYPNTGLIGLLPNFTSQTGSIAYAHQFTRRLRVSVAAGPQWTSIRYLTTTNSYNLFADATASYAGEFSRLSAAYVRGTTSGFGVIAGARSDSVNVSYSRTIGRVWAAAASASYARTSSLQSLGILPFSFNTAVFAVQGSRALGHSLSAYASYTLEHQTGTGSNNNPLVLNSFTGTTNVLGFGLTYSPMAIHFGRR